VEARRRRQTGVKLERVQVVHVNASLSAPGASRGRRHNGEPLAVGARARVRNRRAADVPRAHRARFVFANLRLCLFRKKPFLFLFGSRERGRGGGGFREVRLERLHHLPGLEVDDVHGAARGDGDERVLFAPEPPEPHPHARIVLVRF